MLRAKGAADILYDAIVVDGSSSFLATSSHYP